MMTYKEALLHTISKWNESPISDEWLFVNFREGFIDVMSTVEAFESINDTINILLNQNDESTAIEILESLILLAKQSETTEMPKNLYLYKNNLRQLFLNFGKYANNKLKELFSYYRLE
jgi:hypothetical protein